MIDKNLIWRALGDFFDIFPSEDRVYWDAFWDSYANIVSDLWGLAFQYDKDKDLFATTATRERREVLIKFSGLSEAPRATFRISDLRKQSDVWVLTGSVPERTIKVDVLPDAGTIEIGSEFLTYLRRDLEADSLGFVTRAAFTLDGEPRHVYGDSPDFNDDFVDDTIELQCRVLCPRFSMVLDAVGSGAVDPSGSLDIGDERIEYSDVTVVDDRYVFTLTSALGYDYVAGSPVTVHRLVPGRWNLTGTGMAVGRGSLTLATDSGQWVEAQDSLTLRDNVDFDISLTLTPTLWPSVVANEKRAVMRLALGPQVYDLGLMSDVTGHKIVAGPQTIDIPLVARQYEFRIQRLGNVAKFAYRRTDDADFTVAATIQATGHRATLVLRVDDAQGSGTTSRVSFDALRRWAGEVVQAPRRLAELFVAGPKYPYTYDIDQRITSAPELRDRPIPRSESLTILTSDDSIIQAQGQGTDFVAQGIPSSGVLTISGHQVLYDRVTRTGDTFSFQYRGPLDPDISPPAPGTQITASTRVLDGGYTFDGLGHISFALIPTRDRMWAPVAQVDDRHVQNEYGILTGLDAEVSTDAYLARVQGTWFALMSGPAYGNIVSGLQLAMGLPSAKIKGTVTRMAEEHDALGKLTRKWLVIRGQSEVIEHDLDPGLWPSIDWTVKLGDAIERFQPLTNGVQVWDEISDPLWYQRFTGVSELERFNTLGVYVAVEAINRDSDINAALNFAMRIKPTYVKLILRYLLTSGDEEVEARDDVSLAIRPWACDNSLEFDSGELPDDPDQIYRLGSGHKLGQGLHLGGKGIWHHQTLGDYSRQGPWSGGSIAADVFTGHGGFASPESAGADGTWDGFIFTSPSATFVTGTELTRYLIVDGSRLAITEIMDAHTVVVDAESVPAQENVQWSLWRLGFHDLDVGKDIRVGPDDYKIVELLSQDQVRVLANAQGQDLVWELRDYEKLGLGHRLGTWRAYRCHPGAGHSRDDVDAQQVVTVDAGA